MMMSRTKEGGRERKSARISQNLSSCACVGRCPEQKQIGRLLEVEPAPLHPFHEVANVDAAVEQPAFRGHFVSVLVFAESDDLGNFRQAAHDAVAVDVPQSPLHVVLFVQAGVDDVAPARYLGELHDVL